MLTTTHTERPVVTEELLRRLDVNGPRYTSYPTADRFVDAFGPDDYARALDQRADGGGVIGGASPLSIYVHIPFCESLCYYCACNKVITKHHERATEYLDALEQGDRAARRPARRRAVGVAAALRRRFADLPQRRRAEPRDGRAAAGPSASRPVRRSRSRSIRAR